MKRKLVSVVIPVYNSEKSLEELCHRIDCTLRESGYNYEIILVDDGSLDNSWAVMKSVRLRNRKAKIIRFGRNFGQSNALICGLNYASGDLIVTMDDDLQHPPEEIPRLLRQWENGLEVVSAESGSLVSAQGAPAFFATLDEAGGVWVDLALLGRGLAFEGSGEIAVLTLSGDGVAHLGDVDLRDRKNRSASRHPVDSEPASPGQTTSAQPSGLPSRIELAPARPNPFGTSTEIMFRLPASAPVSLTVHDVTGRLVRTLVDRTVGAGEMSVQWDGRTNDGTLAGAGIYFYTFRTTDHRETRKLIRVN